jgi:hypothetical protein|tara:strand:+ start:312 stop:503 length:192 start_codon:yes stop_codon:yes gene_type:complete
MVKLKKGETMEVLEIECSLCQSFNMLFISELQINESFTCDECEQIILMVDEELLSQTKGRKNG